MLKALGFALLVGVGGFLHALGHLVAGRLAGARVEEFSLGVGPRLLDLPPLSVRLLPAWSYVVFRGQLEEGAYRDLPPHRRLGISLGGPAANFLGAFLFVSGMALAFGRIQAGPAADEVHRVLPGTPAARAGLQRGDRILALDGRPWRGEGLVRPRPAVLEVERGGDRLRLAVPPDPEAVRFGVKLRPPLSFAPLAPGEAPGYALRVVVALMAAPLRPADWSTGVVPLPDGGIFAGPSAWRDFPAAGWLAGLGAANAWLAGMFLLPLPGLDGMRMLIQLAQASGSPLPGAAEERLQGYGVWAFGTAYAMMLLVIAVTG